ncbi:MAG: hypothetical protein HYY13_10935 [Nitrospirae bacterium]|nr:hypothetical protein [Nitrospirota bacterium]
MQRRRALVLFPIAAAVLVLGVVAWLRLGGDGHRLRGPYARRDFLAVRSALWGARESGVQDPVAVAREQVAALSVGGEGGADLVGLLDTYAQYQDRARAFMNLPLSDRQAALKGLRRELFGDELAESLFGEEERLMDFLLARAELHKDGSLTAEERLAREETLRRDIFGEEEAEVPLPNWIQYYNQTASEIRANPDLGAEEREVLLQSLREGLFGAEAAERLRQTEAWQKEWGEREAILTRGLDAVFSDPNLDESTRQARLSALRGDLSSDAWERFMARYQLSRSSRPPTAPPK